MATEISHALKCEVMGIQRSLERGIQEIQRFEEPQLVSDDAIAIIVEYVLSIYVGQCKLKDLPTIPCDEIHTCMLNMEIMSFWRHGKFKSELSYEGEVDVIRSERESITSTFMFTFTAEKTYKLTRGDICSSHALFYSTGNIVNVIFSTHKFE